MQQQYTADYVHDGNGWLPAGATVVINSNSGIIDEILTAPTSNTQKLEGLLCPGFINTHCHLELSHLHYNINKGLGLPSFLQEVGQKRNIAIEAHLEKIKEADDSMLKAGIVAVGDISNDVQSLIVKKNSALHYHTFVEVFGLRADAANEIISKATTIANAFAQHHTTSIVPHAGYSVSASLFQLLNEIGNENLNSIHNQESLTEELLWHHGKGALAHFINSKLPADKPFLPCGTNSLFALLQHWQPKQTLLVHNTYSTAQHIAKAKEIVAKAVWVLCPSANIFIENTMPLCVPELIKQEQQICVGTDSLASNEKLCILTELYQLQQHYTTLTAETLIKWGTLNGALALGMPALGKIKRGFAPGLVHIKNWKHKEKIPASPTIYRLA